jgi:tripartite-type tricarboxylate transporter receptor subunit TctC
MQGGATGGFTMRYRLQLFGIAIASLLFGSAAGADPIADFYKDKQISWILSADAGGGYSTYAHAFAPFFSEHIPGKPKVVVQNMPGAGGIRAMNYLMSVAPKDGTTIGLVHSSVPFAPLYGLEGANFDPRKMNWLGSINTASGICVAWHTSGIKTWDDLMSKEYVVGTSGAGSQMETLPNMLKHLFGAKIKVISGYKGGNEVFLAMERGEVMGRCGGLIASMSSTRPDWLPQKKVEIPIQFALERSAKFPDVPAIAEYAKDEKTKQILALVFSPQAMDRPVLLPPGVPEDRIKALRVAFKKAVEDPRFLEEAKKHKLEVEYVSGEKIQQIINNAFSFPPEIIKLANEAQNVGAATEAK